MRKYVAEGVGTFAIVFTGCGALALGGARLGPTGVALSFGLALAAMTLALSPVSGAHLNPAVTLAMVITGRLKAADALPYWAAQLAGGTAGAGLLVAAARGRPGGAPLVAEAIANGYDRLSPGAYGLGAAAIVETTLTALFVLVWLGAWTEERGLPAANALPGPGRAALLAAAAGAGYGLIHLVGMPVTGMSANPARSLGPALFAGGAPLEQVWLFLVAPLAGGVLAALAHRLLRAPAPAAGGQSATQRVEP
jgi:aquaporin Z